MKWYWQIIKKELSFDQSAGKYFYTLSLLEGAHNVPLPYLICRYSDDEFKYGDVIRWDIEPDKITRDHLVPAKS